MQHLPRPTTIFSTSTPDIIGNRNLSDSNFIKLKIQALLVRLTKINPEVSAWAVGDYSLRQRIANGIQDGIRKARAMCKQAFFFPN
jgi:hypothetical protein